MNIVTVGFKVNLQKLLFFCISEMNNWNLTFQKKLIIAIKKEVLRDKSNKIVDVYAENYKTIMKEIKKI